MTQKEDRFKAQPDGRQGIVDADGDRARIDDVTGALETIEYEHHEVHSGNMFH